MAEYTIIEAGPSHLPSLCTILARSFHPVNPYIGTAFPNTPAIREWWNSIFSLILQDPDYHILIATPSTTSTVPVQDDEFDRSVIGMLIFHFIHQQPGKPSLNPWTSVALTPDHDAEKVQGMLAAGDDAAEKVMGGRQHYAVENLGTDHAWKGKGVGTALLARACEMADERGVEVYVLANSTATSFYERHRFEERERVVIPGDVAYSECKLVRPVQSGES